MEFKDRIKMIRVEKGDSPAQLAAFLGKTESAVRAWEIERSKPDADTLIKLAKYFGCTTDYLLGLSDYKNADEEGEIISTLGILAESMAKIGNSPSLLENLVSFVDIADKKNMGWIASRFLASASFFLKALTEIDKLTDEFKNTQTYDVVRAVDCMLSTAHLGIQAKKYMQEITLQLLHSVRMPASEHISKGDRELTRKLFDVYRERELGDIDELDNLESPVYTDIDVSQFYNAVK